MIKYIRTYLEPSGKDDEVLDQFWGIKPKGCQEIPPNKSHIADIAQDYFKAKSLNDKSTMRKIQADRHPTCSKYFTHPATIFAFEERLIAYAKHYNRQLRGEDMMNNTYKKQFVVACGSDSKGFDKLNEAIEYASRKITCKTSDSEEATIYQAIKEIKTELPPVVINDITPALESK